MMEWYVLAAFIIVVIGILCLTIVELDERRYERCRRECPPDTYCSCVEG